MTLQRRVTVDPAQPVLMTFETAAARYAVTRSTIERWCRSGKLRAIKIGGAVRLNIVESDQALIVSATAESGAASGAGKAIKK